MYSTQNSHQNPSLLTGLGEKTKLTCLVAEVVLQDVESPGH